MSLAIEERKIKGRTAMRSSGRGGSKGNAGTRGDPVERRLEKMWKDWFEGDIEFDEFADLVMRSLQVLKLRLKLERELGLDGGE